MSKIVIIIVFFTFIVFINNLNEFSFNAYNYDNLIGEWVYEGDEKKLILDFIPNKKIIITILSDKDTMFVNGNLSVNFKKDPYTLSITKIAGVNYSLHTIFSFLNDNEMIICNFSKNWRLRPINFLETSKIKLLKKHRR